MLVTTRSRVESRKLITCGLALVILKCYGLGLALGLVACGLALGLVTLKFCELALATKELALGPGLLKMAKFTTLQILQHEPVSL